LEICGTAGIPAALAFLAVLGCFLIGVRGQGSEVSEELPVAQVGGESPTPPFQSPIPDPSCDGWLHVLGGGAAGFVLSVPLGVLSAAPPGLAPVLLGLPLAAVTLMLMFGWIREGRLPAWLPGACVAALLVDLLAAGGIAMPGVAGTFWLLLALALEGRWEHLFRTFTAWAALAGFLLLAVACYSTAYQPVLPCQAEIRWAEREPDRAVQHLEAAAAADPLSAEAWRQLAAIEFEAWWRQPSEAAFSRFTRAKDKALELAPNSALLWLTAGDWEYRAFLKKDEHGKRIVDNALQSAIKSFRRAVQLYPNSAKCHAALAEAHLAAGDRAAFGEEAGIALRLDQLTPHEDKKLPAKLRDRLLRELK
jgi:hypothetical protein